MCNCATTRISGLVVAKWSSHRGKPSLNPRRSTFCLSCCHETSDSKATGGGRGHKVIYRWYWMVLLEWAECYEIEGKRTMLSRTRSRLYIFPLLLLLLFLLVSVSFILIWRFFLEHGVSSEVPSDDDRLWLLSCRW